MENRRGLGYTYASGADVLLPETWAEEGPKTPASMLASRGSADGCQEPRGPCWAHASGDKLTDKRGGEVWHGSSRVRLTRYSDEIRRDSPIGYRDVI